MCHIKTTGMRWRTCGPSIGVTVAILLASLGGTAEAAAPPHWSPDVRSARQYLAHRTGNVSFAVRTERRMWGHHRLRTVPSASVLKAMLMVAYLNRRVRVRRGNRQLAALGRSAPEGRLTLGDLARLVRSRRASPLDGGCYLSVLALDRALSSLRGRRGDAWGSDTSSRVPLPGD